MAEVIGVRFKEVGKVYYFDPLDNKLSAGDMVIVETARGLECGKVATPNKTVSDEELAARKAKWQPREPEVTTGYLARYAAMVTSGNRGAVLEVPHK